MKAKGNVRSTDLNLKGAEVRVSSGRGMTMTRACGLGKEMVANLDAVVKNYKKVIESERRETARQEAAWRRALREAQAFNAIDSLLDTL